MGSTSDARAGAKIPGEKPWVRALEDITVLEVTGDDTRSWLNGQLTNDVRHTKKGDAVYALAVTVKGKILADVWVYDRGDDRFWLAVSTVALPPLLESFESQIIMEDVEIEADASLSVTTVVGPAASEIVEAAGDLSGRVFATARLGSASRDVVLPRDDQTAYAALVAAAEAHGGGAVSDDAWDLACLEARSPRFPIDFDHRNYPQEAGLKDRAVSFQKGCYLGQEVVCMLESRGKLTKRLVVLEVRGGDALPSETSVLADDGDKEVGRITSSVVDGDATLAFGYVKAAFATKGQTLTVAGRAAEVRDVVA